MTARGEAPRRRSTLLPLVIGGAALFLLDFGRRSFRTARLFDPARHPVNGWEPRAYGIDPEAVEELWFETDDGAILHGWYCRTGKPIGSAVYFHGNSGNLTTTAPVIPHLLDSGLNVLMFDYRGFGRSSGRPSIGGVIRDGIAAARLHETLRPAGLPSVVYGFSMGGAVGAQVLLRHSFDGVIFQSTFTTLSDIARATYPGTPFHLLSGGFLDTRRVVARLQLPALFLHGSDDEVCPSWMGKALHDLCTGEARQMAIVHGGGHNDLFEREPARLRSTIREFVSTITPHATPIEIPISTRNTLIARSLRWLRRLVRRRNALPRVVRSAAFEGTSSPPNSHDRSASD